VAVKAWLANAVLMGAVALGLVAIVVWGVQEGRRSNGVRPGEQAPAFAMTRFEGGKVALPELRGRVVMLNFWATWCAPCVREMPHMVKLAQEYESRGLTFIAANREDPPAAVGIFIDQKVPDLKPYVTWAPDLVASVYRVEVLPTTYLIDRQGRIIESHRGELSERQLRKRLEAALELK
jgi:thiol-disulfide isomerase/thioredoxin